MHIFIFLKYVCMHKISINTCLMFFKNFCLVFYSWPWGHAVQQIWLIYSVLWSLFASWKLSICLWKSVSMRYLSLNAEKNNSLFIKILSYLMTLMLETSFKHILLNYNSIVSTIFLSIFFITKIVFKCFNFYLIFFYYTLAVDKWCYYWSADVRGFLTLKYPSAKIKTLLNYVGSCGNAELKLPFLKIIN